MLIYILVVIIILLIGIIFFIHRRCKKCKEELYSTKRDLRQYKDRMTMVEYYFRNFKEGQNPHTTLKDISNLLKDVNN